MAVLVHWFSADCASTVLQMRSEVTMKAKLLCCSILSAVVLSSLPPSAVSQGSANLLVSITAMGSAELGAPVPSLQASEPSLLIPAKVLLRLNPSTQGVLSLSVSDATQSVTVRGDAGPIPISDSPTTIRRYSHSGIYTDSIVLIGVAVTEPLSLHWTLTSSDGAVSWAATTGVPAFNTPGTLISRTPIQ